MSEGHRLAGRRAGLEQQFFLIEESGLPSQRADEFLEHRRETAGSPACFTPESVKGLVEVNTQPVHTLAELERNYVENLGLALGAPLTLRLRLYPLGTYPLPLEPVIRGGPDYRVQARTIGPGRFVDAGRYAGTHLHLELPAGTVSPGASARRGAQPLQSCNGPRPGPRGPDPLVSLLRGAGDRPSRTHGPLPGRRLRVGRDLHGPARGWGLAALRR